MIRKSLSLFLILLLFYSCKSSIGSVKNKVADARIASLQFLEKEHIPGMAVSISKSGNLIWSQGFGYGNLEEQVEVSPKTTQFRIASISKPITALALGNLVNYGKLDLDSAVYDYLPNYPQKKYYISYN